MRNRRATILIGGMFALCALGQPQPAAATAPSTQPIAEDGFITFNLPENIDLKTVVDYASERLKFNVIYQDDPLASQRVTIKAPTRIPAGALMQMLRMLLKVRGFAIIDTDLPGWKRVVLLQGATVAATQPAKAGGADEVQTRLISLKFLDPQRAEQIARTFLSSPAAGGFAIPEIRAVLVTDYLTNVQRIAEVLEQADRPNPNVRVGFLAVRNADAAQLGPQLKQILQAHVRATLLPGQNADGLVEVTQDRRTGQLVVVGPAALVDEAADVVRSLDKPVDEQQSPVRFYKLANTTASDVLETLRALEGDAATATDLPARPSAAAAGPAGATTPAAAAPAGVAQSAMGKGALSPGATLGPGTFVGSGFPVGGGGSSLSNPYGTGVLPGSIVPQGSAPPGLLSASGWQAGGGGGATPAPSGLRTHNATVAADPNTNSLIVVAEPLVQTLYEQLIRALDKRRPQVLLEATVVTIDTTRDLTFGVEVSDRTKRGSSQAVTFTSFGFSTPNAASGQLTLTPGAGFNGVVIGSDLAQVIVRALAHSSRARVTAAPRVLVNDNATGTLSSLTEQPYTQTSIGTTIATTSFGGYAQAGTVVTLTPHISEADYLQLEYQVTLSSFTSPASSDSGIPPGIVQDSVQSKVTIPDGATVVVGGLNQSNVSKAISSVPLLDRVPILNVLLGRHDDTSGRSTLFVFLRPIILRDDKFEDLKFLSDKDLAAAELPRGMPASGPIPMR